MNYSLTSGPYIKDTETTSKIMHKILVALIPIILFTILKNGIMPYQNGYTTLGEAFKPILMMLVSVGVALFTEALYFIIFKRKKGHALKLNIMHSYPFLPALIMALTLSINTPIWLVAAGSFFATVVAKLLFGGFGRYKFNPAVVGNLFITIVYLIVISSNINYLNSMESANVIVTLYNFKTFLEYLFGFMVGPIGTTCNIFMILALVYLTMNKAIKWAIPAACIATIFLMTLFIGLMNGITLWYPVFYILSSGILFVLVFMATDFITSPTTRNGQVFYGIFLGLLTVITNFFISFNGSILIALLIMNSLVFLFDKLGVRMKLYKKFIIIPIFLIILIVAVSIFCIGVNL